MSGQPVIEPARFARFSGRIEGDLDVARLPRVAELLAEGPGSVHYLVTGSVNDRGHSVLHVQLDGSLPLRCQRCLGVLSQPLHAVRDLVLVPGADEFAPLQDEADTEDVIPEVARLELAPLLEEELLLALPLAPRHEGGDCRTEAAAGGSEATGGTEQPPSPFAALAKLKQ
jgi:uncharacterized protein